MWVARVFTVNLAVACGSSRLLLRAPSHTLLRVFLPVELGNRFFRAGIIRWPTAFVTWPRLPLPLGRVLQWWPEPAAVPAEAAPHHRGQLRGSTLRREQWPLASLAPTQRAALSTAAGLLIMSVRWRPSLAPNPAGSPHQIPAPPLALEPTRSPPSSSSDLGFSPWAHSGLAMFSWILNR